MRARLCIQPVAASWRMAASTTGKPVRPSRQARDERVVAIPFQGAVARLELDAGGRAGKCSCTAAKKSRQASWSR